jgi:CubicO group peptidase (beta-lactamase class C family)
VSAEAWWFGQPAVERGNLASIENHLTQKLREAAENKRLGSAALVLVQEGMIVSEHGFGVSSAETQAPVKTDQTLFQLASVSKIVTAFGVMKLVEDEKIGLDEPVMRYLKRWQFPGSESHRDKVTVRHLLSHTAGIDDGSSARSFLPGEAVPTLEESLGGVTVVREPGAVMSYSSSAGYAILQLLIEDVTNRPFADYMKEAVLQPLGMAKSSFELDAIEQNLAPGFDSELNPQPRRRYTATGAVSLYAAPQDLARFALAFTGENPVLKQETLKQMMTPQHGTAGTWGLGTTLFVRNDAASYVVGHDGGSVPAWGAMMRVNPATGNGMVLIVSGGRGAVNQLPHDWVYWETGKMTFEGRRQILYDRIKGFGLAAFFLGAIAIVLWKMLR